MPWPSSENLKLLILTILEGYLKGTSYTSLSQSTLWVQKQEIQQTVQKSEYENGGGLAEPSSAAAAHDQLAESVVLHGLLSKLSLIRIVTNL